MNLNSPEYPDLLKHIHNPPKQLYWKGDISILQEKICISFVGSRNFTPYGREVVEKLVCDLSLCDVVIVSGLARGIDSIAHEAALRHGLKTVAVLGTGIDIVYPEENVSLADRIVRGGGCVLSEYPGDTPVRDFQFPMRNRIIAGLSLGTVVIEAPE
ncbi:DNA-protecting protein DprA, partial [Candidatus Peregrinibacteria bacterium]|nr:DNA-protecting protein DprA [Candidatus Peregrinibacteria bacterium]